MNKIQIENLDYENVSITIKDINVGIIIKIHGSIDMSYPQFKLDPYFERIHQAVLSFGIKKVYCNLHNLIYINSSGIRSLIKWIMTNINLKDTGNAYHIIFKISSEHKWQSASLGFITNLCPEFIHVIKDKINEDSNKNSDDDHNNLNDITI